MNGDRPKPESLRRQLRILWAALDRVHSMVWEKETAGQRLTNTETHIRNLALEVTRAVPYPGEPPESPEEKEG